MSFATDEEVRSALQTMNGTQPLDSRLSEIELKYKKAALAAAALGAADMASASEGDKMGEFASDEEIKKALESVQHGPSEDYAPPKQHTTRSKAMGEAALQLGSGMVGGLAGLGAETGALGLNLISSKENQNDPAKVKRKVEEALTIPAKSERGKAMVENVANLPILKQIGELPDYVSGQFEDPNVKAAIDIGTNIAMGGAPKLLTAGAKGAKYLMRGGEEARKTMEANVGAYKRAGVPEPSLGQVSAGGVTKGAGARENISIQQAQQVAAQHTKLADSLHAAQTSEEAGNIISQAIEGAPEMETVSSKTGKSTWERPTGKKEDGWVQDVKEKEGELHQKWQKLVGETTPVTLDNTIATLAKMTTPVKGAEATTMGLINKRLLDIRNRMLDDVSGNAKKMPLNAVEEIRSLIGDLTDPAMDAPLNAKQANALYGAMKEDITKAVAAKGPRALKAYDQAFEYSRNMHDVSESIMQPLRDTKTPEKIVTAAMSGTKDGASVIKKLFKGQGEVRGLNPAEQDVVRSIILRRLGEAEGHDFDIKAFTNNWSNMHADAKNVLFGPEKSNLRNSLDALAKVAKEHAPDETSFYKLKNYAAQHGIQGTVGIAAAVLHQMSAASVLLAPAVLGYISGRIVTSPRFIKWLTSTGKNKSYSLKPALTALLQRAASAPPEEKREIEKYVKKVEATPIADVLPAELPPDAGKFVSGITPGETVRDVPEEALTDEERERRDEEGQ